MRILYLCYKYDYGDRQRGLSFEHTSFFIPLHLMGHHIMYFDMTHMKDPAHRPALNARLEEMVKSLKPDVLFCIPMRDEFDKRIMRRISRMIPTVAWFADDHWKFDVYTRDWAPCFGWSVTTSQSAMPRYAKIGYRNVIKSQWACNHFLWRKLDLPLKYDVTFIGQPHGIRRALVEYLRANGVSVQAWGKGWDQGWVTSDGMVEVFNQSRINLNFTNSFVASAPKRRTLVDKVLGRIGRRLQEAPPPMPVATAPDMAPVYDSTIDQIKGRNFEIPGCGGFTMTGAPENLYDYFVPGREVAAFSNAPELLDRVRYYLAHEDERAAVAEAGHCRTLAEHTYVHRFADIFSKMGVANESAAEILRRGETPGTVEYLLPDES